MSCITDNGAGGLSSSIGEMAEYTNGCEIDLEAVPLKQAGLSPWEILVSESQERMTVSVRSDDIAAFETLAALHEVEATKVARFTSDGDFHVKFGKKTVGLLPLEFFHNGVPQLNLESEWKTPTLEPFSPPKDINHSNILLEMLARPNIASKETWVRQYDHEVIAQTAVKPFVGVENDGPGNSGVLAPIHGNPHGFVVSNGIVPRYSDIDAGAMAEAAVDEALRNAVCSGVNLDRIAGLDNFCWPDPIESTKTPDGKFKLAQLVRANRQLEMACRAYRLPCISGKDSMKNDYGKGKDKISIPPTLLFSLIGDKVDVRNIATSDFKPGERIHLVGKSLQELGASEVTYHLGSNIGGDVPRLHNPESNLEMYRSLTSCINNGVVITAHDCSDGGLAVAIAEMCIGGRCGASIDIDGPGDTDEWGKLWGESLARIVIGVSPDKEEEFLKTMSQHPTTYLGEVTENNTLEIYNGDEKLVNLQIEEMVTSWKGTLDMTGGVE